MSNYHSIERIKEKKTDYIEKLEDGEANLEDLDEEEMEDVLDELEDEFDQVDIDKANDGNLIELTLSP